jgi:hypothetical protein
VLVDAGEELDQAPRAGPGGQAAVAELVESPFGQLGVALAFGAADLGQEVPLAPLGRAA